MAEKFEMSMMGELTFFLGLQIKELTDGFFVYQAKYIANMLKKFKFTNCKPDKTAMSSLAPISTDPNAANINATLYRGMIGSLLYLTASLPDIMFHRLNLGLWYPRDSEFKLIGYTDFDHSECGIDYKCTLEGAQMIRDKLVSWSSKKQSSLSCSTTEAEYVADGRCCAKILWIQNQLLDYGLNF
ncbi:uncharacterized mitochondrial protein AtMg00810-like [Lactuca sativa]|uniref:uncharacterized mitochondrial protein AtMg00810-like n=1 Tax=Lactuca sativa TaxID=4236 RepID=UPI000CD9920E|nr:uncharacterized mitochondrial protein AtMg00810-like [Lactuca sativa]